MLLNEWNKLESEIATLILADNMSLQEAIWITCNNNPNSAVNALLLAAISFATHYEIHNEIDLPLALAHHRTVVALTADVAALRHQFPTCTELLTHWWITEDSFFQR